MFNSEIKKELDEIKKQIEAISYLRRNEEDLIVGRIYTRLINNEKFIWGIIQRIKEFQLSEKK